MWLRPALSFPCNINYFIFVSFQVAGELSNDGQPMRRFMQSFVLAPQTPKKYYLHNDIFRYQDEVFHDDDSEADLGRW